MASAAARVATRPVGRLPRRSPTQANGRHPMARPLPALMPPVRLSSLIHTLKGLAGLVPSFFRVAAVLEARLASIATAMMIVRGDYHTALASRRVTRFDVFLQSVQRKTRNNAG